MASERKSRLAGNMLQVTGVLKSTSRLAGNMLQVTGVLKSTPKKQEAFIATGGLTLRIPMSTTVDKSQVG